MYGISNPSRPVIIGFHILVSEFILPLKSLFYLVIAKEILLVYFSLSLQCMNCC